MPRRSFLVWEMLLRQLCMFAKLYDTNLYLRAMMLSSSGGDPRMQRLGAVGPGHGCQHVGCSQHLECSWIFAACLHNLHCTIMGCTLLCEKKARALLYMQGRYLPGAPLGQDQPMCLGAAMCLPSGFMIHAGSRILSTCMWHGTRKAHPR